MPRAIWNGEVIAESDDTIVVEGNHYFPIESVRPEFLVESDKHTGCPWKGTASYYTIEVNDSRKENGAWYYPNPKPAAKQIKGRVAFTRGVKIVQDHKSDGDDAHESGLLRRLVGVVSR